VLCDILLTVTTPTTDVLVIGAGIVGASIAYHATAAGLRTWVVERAGIAGGTSSACEGNILVSDKGPGAELDLALLSRRLWVGIADDLGPETIEFDFKGGVVVAKAEATAVGLAAFAEGQRGAGVDVDDLDPADLLEREPNLGPDVAGGAWYPQDCQLQPMLATARMLERARDRGAVVHTGVEVTGITRDPTGRVSGVTTSSPTVPGIAARWVVNAAGTWAGEVSALAGAPLPILPRRGFVLVTEPLPLLVRHKVYTAEYVANVASSAADLQTSVVIEGTRSGTILIGASRERVGFDRTYSVPVVRRLAAQAIGVFPFLADVRLLRTYLGFRPYCPDHLPVIGADARAPGLIHAAGHEGAGICLAASTGHLIAQLMAGVPTDRDLGPFRPDRFAEAAA
jgi:glycine/D-amino acid oxidase-like deaminating enzyme